MEECDLAALQAWMHVSAGCSLLHAGGRGEGHWTEGQQGEKKRRLVSRDGEGGRRLGQIKKIVIVSVVIIASCLLAICAPPGLPLLSAGRRITGSLMVFSLSP